MNKHFYLYNPLDEDVTTTYALDAPPEGHTLPAEKITEFDNEIIFNHMRNYLVDIILNQRNELHFDVNRAAVREEVTKNL